MGYGRARDVRARRLQRFIYGGICEWHVGWNEWADLYAAVAKL